MKSCTFESCLKELRNHNKTGYCTQHRHLALGNKDYKRDWYRNKTTLKTMPRERNSDRITGDYSPLEGKTSVYALIRNGEVFYVGSSVNPANRMTHHVTKLKEPSLRMAILKTVSDKDAMYWECRFIVEYIDAGCKLDNVLVPTTGRPGRKGIAGGNGGGKGR